MSALETVIRGQRRQLEMHRRFLSGLMALRARLVADAADLAAAEGESEEPIADRRCRLGRSIAAVDGQILQARAAVGEALDAIERHELAAARHGRTDRRRRAAGA